MVVSMVREIMIKDVLYTIMTELGEVNLLRLARRWKAMRTVLRCVFRGDPTRTNSTDVDK